MPNAALGIAYYLLLLLAVPWLHARLGWDLLLAAACAAAAMSLYLGYSLLFVTRRPCVYCWSSHLINLTLLLLVWQARNIS